MPCIFPYFGKSKSSPSLARSRSDGPSQISYKGLLLESEGNYKEPASDGNSDSDLDSDDGRVYCLKRKLTKADLTIGNLESLLKTIMHKQNELSGEVHELRCQNTELVSECQMQRDYQTMERNTMLRELQEVRVRLRDRSRLLEKTVAQNRDLMYALQAANEKIYLMGVKMLKMQARQRQSMAATTPRSTLPASTRGQSDEERESSSWTSDTDY